MEINVKEIINDFISRDVYRIRKAGAEIINNSQNENAIKKLIPYKWIIKLSTIGLELGGLFASNNRFYKFPLEIIEFHKRHKNCTCHLYLSESYLYFNPEVQSQQKSLKLNCKIKGNWTYDYEVECLKCQNKYHVSMRNHHVEWWKWTKITQSIEFERSGNEDLDKELNLRLAIIATILNNELADKSELKFHKENVIEFRMKIANNDKTNNYEAIFKWSILFNNLIERIDVEIDT